MENIILIKEEIDCDIETAFTMFIDNNYLENWLTVKADVNPEVGGKYELFWVPEDRKSNSTIGCRITGIDRNKFISFNWKGPTDFESFMNSADPLTHIIVFLFQNDSNSNKTFIYLFHTGWRNGSEWNKARNYFQNAWSKALWILKKKIADKQLP
ncbi:MAG: SRPBCC domain-containing protein [Candidatus Hodarchaeota archaeon]